MLLIIASQPPPLGKLSSALNCTLAFLRHPISAQEQELHHILPILQLLFTCHLLRLCCVVNRLICSLFN